MFRKVLLGLLFVLFVGCKSSYINEGKVIHHDDYDHYYIVKEQGTDKNIEEKVETITDKVKSVFKKKPVKSDTVKTNKPVKIPKRRVRKVTPVPSPVIQVDESKLMPMTKRQVEIVELKNDLVISVAFVQSILLLISIIFIIVLWRRHKKKPQNKPQNTNDKVLDHDK